MVDVLLPEILPKVEVVSKLKDLASRDERAICVTPDPDVDREDLETLTTEITECVEIRLFHFASNFTGSYPFAFC